MERAELIRDVIQAAAEFHQRQLWKRFSNFDCFAVRVPGMDDPLLACVMGAAGEQYGLMLLQGPRAVEHLESILSDDGPGDDAPEEMSMLSFSMDAFGDMAAESQAFFRQAGIHPRHEDQVPGFLVKPPGRQPRMPDDSELALFLTVLKTAVAADRRRLLTPARLDDADGICVATLGGDLTDPTISVTRERSRRQARAPQATPLPAARMDLSGLDLLDETWLVGTPAVPGGIKGDGRSMQLVLVAEDSSGKVLQACPVLADQTSEAVAALEDTFRGHRPGGRRGLPRMIVFSSRKLHDAAAPSLTQAGVKCVFMATIPQLQEIAADFVKFLNRSTPSLPGDRTKEGAEDSVVPAPDDLAGWKEADLRLSQRFADFLGQGGLLRSTRAAKRYFDDDDIKHFFKEHEQRGVAMAYSSWGILDYRSTKAGKTQAERMLAEGLPPAQEMLLRARMETHPTVYRVAGHDPKAGTVDLEDVLLADTVTVHDQLLSENIDNNLFLVARAFAAGRFHFMEVAGRPLGAGMGMEAVEFLRDCRMDFTPEGMRRDAHKFGWLWGWTERWQANWKPPRLTNTDGDELLWHTASFSVADPSAARQGLLKRPDIDHNEEEDEFVWINDAGKGAKMLGGPVTLGRVEFVGDELVLTVNSARRFEKARVWLEGLPGVAFRNVATRRWDEPEEARPPDERMSKPQPVEITPEMTAALQEMTNSQYMGWVDTPLPVLGGKTPRQACRTPAGRQQVALLIRTMPDPMGQAPVHVPRHAMLRELGLEGESPAPSSASPRPPSLLPAAETPASTGKVGRNDPCPCGSGKKYKKCCGR